MLSNFALLVAAASSVMASPSPKSSDGNKLDGYRLINTDNVNGVYLHWFGPEEGDATIEARGGSDCNDQATSEASEALMHCDDSHGGDEAICGLLVDTLGGSMDTAVPSAPRQICVSDHDSWCCTSWSVETDGLTYGDLHEGAQRIWNNCNTNGVSGYLEMYKLGGGDACMHQCVSNRGTGC